MNMRKKAFVIGIVMFLSLLALVFWWKASGVAQRDPAPEAPDVVPTTVRRGVPGEGTVGYRNEKYRFSLEYPQALTVNEYAEAGDAITVTFEDDTGELGFQVFVTPYSNSQITPERFRIDQPSGVFAEPTDIVVDGVRATMFFGKNSVMGDTREAWFIYPGPGQGAASHLYEVET
jgi:hypothetical protein